jgi:hypothetical protein
MGLICQTHRIATSQLRLLHILRREGANEHTDAVADATPNCLRSEFQAQCLSNYRSQQWNTRSPLNGLAAKWAAEHLNLLP